MVIYQASKKCLRQESLKLSFFVWGIDFMSHFQPSFGNQYSLVVVDYVSMWVEEVALPINDAKVVTVTPLNLTIHI